MTRTRRPSPGPSPFALAALPLAAIVLVAASGPFSAEDAPARSGAVEAVDDRYPVGPNPGLEVEAPGVLSNDLGAPTGARLISGPRNASVFEFFDDGSFTYTPVPGFVGTDSFEYEALGSPETATVRLEVALSRDPRLADSVVFAVIGDFGDPGSNAHSVASMVHSWDPEFVISIGDNNYEFGEASTIDANIGAHYARDIFPYHGAYGDGAPDLNRFFPIPGNHDFETDLGQPLYDYMALPGNERYFTFTWGPVQFFGLSSDEREPDGTTSGSRQGRWLQAALAASTAPWKVVYLHHPPYVSRDFDYEHLRWPFAEWGADVVVAGHFHLYERLVVGGTPYLVNGLGGRSLSHFDSPDPHSQFRYTNDYGAQRVTANACTLRFDLHAVHDPAAVIDSITLRRCVSELPDAADDNYEATEDTRLDVAAPGVLVNDRFDGSRSISVVPDSAPFHAASFRLHADGSFHYLPAPGFVGVDTFTYHLESPFGRSATATATLHVSRLVSATTVCWLVADEEPGGSSGDFLTRLLPTTGFETPVGPTLTETIEALAVEPRTGRILAADGARIGTLDPATGLFTPLASPGSADGPSGEVDLSDLDGLSFDPADGSLFASNRGPEFDVLVRIDPETGRLVPGAFVPGGDYVRIRAGGHVDDIAVDPLTRAMYVLYEEGTGPLVGILDPADGAVSGVVRIDGTDLEGLGFTPDGTLVASQGGDNPGLFAIDPVTGMTRRLATPGADGHRDFEAVDCRDSALAEPPGQTGPSADLDLTLTSSSTAPDQGATVVVTAMLRHEAGADAAGPVSVSLAVPPGLTLQAAEPGAGTAFEGGTWSVPTLAPGGSVALRLTIRADEPDPTTTCAWIAAAQPLDPDSTPGGKSTGEDDTSCLVLTPVATGTPLEAACYLVADETSPTNGADFLSGFSPASGVEIAIGSTGTTSIEAVAVEPSTGRILVADAGSVGTLDPATGRFVLLGRPGSARGPAGDVEVQDMDGLAFDPGTGGLYASVRSGAGDLLIRLDPASGALWPDAFGAARDYVVMPTPRPVEDLAFHPATRQLFVLYAGGDGSLIARFDPASGALSPGVAVPVPNLEGLGFTPDGHLLATEGNAGKAVWMVDPGTGGATLLAPIGALGRQDYEALDCRAAPGEPGGGSGGGEGGTGGGDGDDPPVPSDVCYVVADEGSAGGSADVLVAVAKSTNQERIVGPTGTTSVEAVAFDPFSRVLYAVDADALGTLDPSTGRFAAVGRAGSGRGGAGTLAIADVDGITFDPHSGHLYGGVRRLGAEDLLVRLDPATGTLVADAFGTGSDYVLLAGTADDNVDDLAIDPVDGRLIAILQNSDRPSRLVAVDRTTGATTPLVTLDRGDVEGLTFDGDGTLIGTLGTEGNAIVVIDRATGSTLVRTTLGSGGNGDFEAIDCLTNDINSLVVRLIGASAQDATGDIPLGLFRDASANGLLDPGDVLLATDRTGPDGTLEFRTAASGSFMVGTREGAVAAVFPGFGERLELSVPVGSVVSTTRAADPSLPREVTLSAAWPNPFNPTTRFTYSLPAALQTRITVHDLLGRQVRLVVSGLEPAGRHEVSLDASDLRSGMYLVRLRAGGEVRTRTVTLLR